LEIVTKCYRRTAEEEEGGDRKLRGLFTHCPGDQIKDSVIGYACCTHVNAYRMVVVGKLKTINRLEDRRRLDDDTKMDRKEKGVD
jgi:hypothetical protein